MQRQTANELQKLLISVELLAHIFEHRHEVSSSCSTDFILQQLIATCSPDTHPQASSHTDIAGQDLQAWSHPSKQAWVGHGNLAARAIHVLNWLNSCVKHEAVHVALIDRLCWILASQVAGLPLICGVGHS